MIIGLCGFINSGKGTVADILSNKHDFIKESFANSVKDAVSVIFEWDREMLEGATPESRAWREQPDVWWSDKFGRPFSPRTALQIMGTEAGRNSFHQDLWIYSLLRRMHNTMDYVIADVRFPNEIKAIKQAGGKVFHIQRGPLPDWYADACKTNKLNDWSGIGQQMLKYSDIHYSEWAWCGMSNDGVIHNNSTLEDLEKKVDLILQ
jgi:hypothetical protein